jgi:tRNA (cytidine/uridine-2'-O-)-methyltransferase
MGFRLDERTVQRAGLDYWQHLDLEIVDSWQQMLERIDLQRAWFFTKFAQQLHSEVKFQPADWLVFGSESSGLPESVRTQWLNHCVRLPMTGPVRSLNLSVSVGIGLFEAYRQCSIT